MAGMVWPNGFAIVSRWPSTLGAGGGGPDGWGTLVALRLRMLSSIDG